MLKLMTFNIRYGTADDGNNKWDHRKQLVIDRIQAFNPDLLGMQECRDDFQSKFIKSNLQEYDFYGVRRAGGGETSLEMAPILFKRSMFRLVQKGCFWLSETPDVPGSVSWGSTFPRTATWVQLVQLGSGKELIYINTHFDYEPSAIDESARLLQRWITEKLKSYPVLLTGDFNTDKNSFAYRQLTQEAGLSDAYRKIYPTGATEGTFHGFGEGKPISPIDWVLISNHFEVISAGIDRYYKGSLFPSDHYPVFTELNWK